MKRQTLPYPPNLKTKLQPENSSQNKSFDEAVNFRRELRQDMTRAELQMWYWLRARRFNNLKFRRQHPMGPYIVDYYCDELRLVIEIDGDIHAFEKQVMKDKNRTEYLKNRGLRVIRYSNHEVRLNLGGVLQDLWEITQRLRRDPLPTLSLKRRGES